MLRRIVMLSPNLPERKLSFTNLVFFKFPEKLKFTGQGYGRGLLPLVFIWLH